MTIFALSPTVYFARGGPKEFSWSPSHAEECADADEPTTIESAADRLEIWYSRVTIGGTANAFERSQTEQENVIESQL